MKGGPRVKMLKNLSPANFAPKAPHINLAPRKQGYTFNTQMSNFTFTLEG